MDHQHFYINRAAGDTIYALAVIKAMGGGMITTGLEGKLHDSLTPLLAAQPYITNVNHESNGIPPGVINLDIFRYNPMVNCKHFIHCLSEVAGIAPVDPTKQWLTLPPYQGNSWSVRKAIPGSYSYAVINVTPRYRDKFFNWGRELAYLQKRVSVVYFIGHADEYWAFNKKYPGSVYFDTRDHLEAAYMIAYCRMFSGTQSSMLAIAEGLGRGYRFERSPWFTNTMTGPNNMETIINPVTRKLHWYTAKIQELFKGPQT